VLTVTQATELGTLYTLEELQTLGELARSHDLKLHMDGARFANAVASLEAAPAELTWKAGVDVLTFGGTKNGMPVGEAVIFFDRELARDFEYRCKQAGQLASKMRFLAAPWVGLLESGGLLSHAAHANRCARLLAERLLAVPGVALIHQVQANSLFVRMPQPLIDLLRAEGWHFYTFIGSGHARFMCSWQTREEDVLWFGNEVLRLAETLA
jgi:threonine aldolase